MGMYDNHDPDIENKGALALFIFALVLCLIMTGANLFAGAGISWIWVFAPVWGPMLLGFVLSICGIRPPGQE